LESPVSQLIPGDEKMPLKINVLVAGLMLLILPITVFAEEGKQADIDKAKQGLEKLYQIREQGEVWAARQKTISRERYQQCYSAFGHKSFCQCLSGQLHWVLGFDSYINIITASSAEIEAANDEERVLIDSVYKAREYCVDKHIQTK
jgi:hypothetical protein